MRRAAQSIVALLLVGRVVFGQGASPAMSPSVASYVSIQEAIDKNPGAMVFVPAGDYQISEMIKIATDNTGLWGPGRITQTNPAALFLQVRDAANVRIRDLTFARPAEKATVGTTTISAGAIEAKACAGLVLDGLRIYGNRSRVPAIRVEDGANIQVVNCVVENYMCIGVDDRTNKPHLGYAFHCLDGTGMDIRSTKGARIQGNRVVEHELFPTEEIKQRHQLGTFVKKNAEKGAIISQQTWDANYTDAWHQGSAIHLGEPAEGDYVQILGNHIENAAQGIDGQNDHVIVANNIVNNAHIGMKATHGARNVVITGNQFSKIDLWAIGLLPGVASHEASAATPDREAREANVNGGVVIANNIISDFGYGHSAWIWESHGRYPIRLEKAKLGKPPVMDVVIQGNLLYDTGRDKILVDGQPQVVPPRYKYAVFIETHEDAPRGIHFSANLFHPGTEGISNVPLEP